MSYHKEGSSTTIGPCNARVGGNEQIAFNLAAYIYTELVSIQNTSEFVCYLALVLRFECPEGAFMCHSAMSSPTFIILSLAALAILTTSISALLAEDKSMITAGDLVRTTYP